MLLSTLAQYMKHQACMQGHRAKEQRFCTWLCMDTALFTPQFLFEKLAILDVGGGVSPPISQLQAGALSITSETV